MDGIGHITILVRDYDEALDFYTRKLGFHKIRDDKFGENFRWVSVAPKEDCETLLVFVKADTTEKIKAIGKQSPDHVLITVDTSDIDNDYSEMKKRGVKFRGEPESVMWGKEVVFEDLYGNLFDLVQRNNL